MPDTTTPDGMDGQNFNRASFDRGIEIVSTLILQIGVAAQTLKPEDNAHTVCMAQVQRYVEGLQDEDLHELIKVLDLMKSIRWEQLQAIAVMRALGIL